MVLRWCVEHAWMSGKSFRCADLSMGVKVPGEAQERAVAHAESHDGGMHVSFPWVPWGMGTWDGDEGASLGSLVVRTMDTGRERARHGHGKTKD